MQSEREGYITYTIDILPDRALQTEISHAAEIVFDINSPIYTNIEQRIIVAEVASDNTNSGNELFVFPNPTKDIIRIENIEKFETFAIYNANQKYIKGGIATSIIDISELHDGIYIITLIADTGFRKSAKIVKY